MATNQPNYIEHFRTVAGLSKEELARRAGTSGQQIGHLENSRIALSVSWAKRLAIHLGCDWRDLFDGVPVNESRQSKEVQKIMERLPLAEQEIVLAYAQGVADRSRVPSEGGNDKD